MPSEKLVAETATPGFNQSIPGKIMTPDSVQTRIGTLEFVDGVPTTATTQIVYDHLDFLRGVEVFLNFIPAASLEGLRLGQIERGATVELDHLETMLGLLCFGRKQNETQNFYRRGQCCRIWPCRYVCLVAGEDQWRCTVLLRLSAGWNR